MYIVVLSKTSLWLAIGPTLRLTTRIGPGPFQASLLSLVQKTSKPGKYRAVHNFSYLHEPALDVALINSWIDSNNFPCTWGTFTTVAPIIMHLLPGSQPAQQFQPCVSQGCVVCCCCQLLPWYMPLHHDIFCMCCSLALICCSPWLSYHQMQRITNTSFNVYGMEVDTGANIFWG